MIERKRRPLRAVILWLIETGLSLLRHSATRKAQQPIEQNEALAKLKTIAVAMLQQALAQGHTCIPLNELVRLLCSRHKDFARNDVSLALRQLSQQGDIAIRGDIVSLHHVARAEENIAHRLRHIGRRSRRINPRHLADWANTEGDQLNEEQRAALRTLTTSPTAILTGAPGTGKTVTIKALSAILERAGYQVYLTAPTGRAAARLSEATGKPAQTLHRLLHKHRQQQPIRDLIIPPIKEAVIVDEASMLDLFLAERLVEFCTSLTKLIFSGDVYQLPPVGPGQVFRDLIESGQIPVVELTNIIRQSEQSAITAAARRIKAGAAPELPSPGEVKSDCYFIEANSAFKIQRLVVAAATSSLPKRCGADPHCDIQVLTPMRKGPLGTIALNKLIRDSLNQSVAEAYLSTRSSQPDYRPNDRVLQTGNNYDIGVFNGECGIVEDVTSETVTVRIGERRVEYPQTSFPELVHGFAITIHRSQGSEYPFVIIPVHESQSVMLTRELLYTALTRAERWSRSSARGARLCRRSAPLEAIAVPDSKTFSLRRRRALRFLPLAFLRSPKILAGNSWCDLRQVDGWRSLHFNRHSEGEITHVFHEHDYTIES
jgi:exodeoxyribonuclease V alpha subunit